MNKLSVLKELNGVDMMNKTILCIALSSACVITTTNAVAALPAKASLGFEPGVNSTFYGIDVVKEGSYFGMDTNGGGISLAERTAISQNDGLILGTAQPASGSHGGAVDGSESPGFDNPWEFFTNTGMHGSTSPTTVLSASGNTATIDMSGWFVSWNGIAIINMGGGTQECGTDIDGICVTTPPNPADAVDIAGTFNNGTGIATITCAVDCAVGDTYTLDYDAVVPQADPSNFGGVSYTLHLEGTVVADLNQAPVVTNDPLLVSIEPNATTTIDLPANVTDPDGDGIDNTSVEFTYTGSKTGLNAPTIADIGLGVISYTDNEGAETGLTPDTFTYTIADSLGKIAGPFTVEVTIAANPPPVANADSDTTNKNTAIVVDVLFNDTDAGGLDPATVTPVVPIIGGVITSINSASGEVTFTPDTDFTGAASFSYTVDDNLGATSNAATVSITVNDPPVASAPVPFNVDRGSTLDIAPSEIATDSDDGLDLTTVLADAVTSQGGSTTVDGLTGVITYTPPMTIFIGPDSFTFTIKDNNGAISNSATINILVNNIVPNADNDAATLNTSTDATVDINVLDGDTDVDGTIDQTTVVATDGTGGGTTAVDPVTGIVTFTPNGTDYTDTFTYTVKDNNGGISNSAIVTVSVSSGAGVLDPAAFLTITPGDLTNATAVQSPVDGNGSWFNMEVSPGQLTHVAIAGFNHIELGTSQLGSVPMPNIDNPWLFFGNLGVHQTTSPVTIGLDDGAGNVTLNFLGWDVSWNNIPSIPLGERAHSGGQDGIATMTCANDCSFGDTYIINYYATVPDGDPSNFGNVKYILHLEGEILEFPPIVGGGQDLVALPPNVDTASATDSNGVDVTIVSGSTASSIGNTSGLYLTASEVGLKDPLLNDDDGQQCIGGCIDFEVSGLQPGSYVDLVVHLNAAIPDGAKYRKLMNGVWQDFDLSSGDQIGSASAVAGLCQGPAGIFNSGLRVGAECLFIRIYDGGPNDADGVANGTVVDPSGILVAGSPNTPAGSSDGCNMSGRPVSLISKADWLIVFAFIALLGLRTGMARRNN